MYSPSGAAINIDLLLTNRSRYTPHDASLNRLNGYFAQVNVRCNTFVQLRVTTVLSCSSGQSCKLCDELSSASLIAGCYAAGCSCFGTTVSSESACSGSSKEAHRASYSCAIMNQNIVLPGGAMVAMTVYDFDTGPSGGYAESLTVPSFDYCENARIRTRATISHTHTTSGRFFLARSDGCVFHSDGCVFESVVRRQITAATVVWQQRRIVSNDEHGD